MNNKILVNIPTKIKTHYPIFVGGSLYHYSSWLPNNPWSRIVIITDDFVKIQYGLKLSKILKKAGFPTLLLSFPAGEKFKNHITKRKLETQMLKHHCDRDTLIVALGGGVVGDVAGFIAATYLRGISYIQIPTTLLAMVDSSIGGKTGINTSEGKNLIGAIHQPICVLTDITLLKSLPNDLLIHGLIEAIKMFITFDLKTFNYCQKNLNKILNREPIVLKKIITRAIKLKARIVAKDEKELTGERFIFNFGHTIGHALEKISKYKLLHGHAVAYGILVEANISHILGFLNESQLLKIKKLLSDLGFYDHFLKKFKIAQILKATKNDKKTRSGQVRYVLIKNIGCTYITNKKYVHSVPDSIVKHALNNSMVLKRSSKSAS